MIIKARGKRRIEIDTSFYVFDSGYRLSFFTTNKKKETEFPFDGWWRCRLDFGRAKFEKLKKLGFLTLKEDKSCDDSTGRHSVRQTWFFNEQAMTSDLVL